MKHAALLLAPLLGSAVVQAGEVDPRSHDYWSTASTKTRTEVIAEYQSRRSIEKLPSIGETIEFSVGTQAAQNRIAAPTYSLLAGELRVTPWSVN